MAFKIFLTGVTGYIAGDALFALARRYPEADCEFAALVRSPEAAAKVRAAYPRVRIVMGALEDAEVLRREAAWADLVLHAADAAEHISAALAIASGLVEEHSPSRPGYWLHTGGLGILTYFDAAAERFGEPPSDLVFDDLDGVAALTNLPDEAFHREVDKIVLECGTKYGDSVRTALVCAPTIYGNGRGPVATRGRQCYEMAKVILTRGYIPIIGTGEARSGNVHIHDLTEAYILLISAALAGNSSHELWGAKGYHLPVTGEHAWGPLARAMGSAAQQMGLLPSPRVGSKEKEKIQEYQMSKDEALEAAGWDGMSWGMNARGKGLRLEKFLGWKANHPSLEDEVPGIVRAEAERLGLS
ncbi:hypothetical protein F4777DRAFT_580664 [Nemania sp. FL0916]|nr:hypothetical protein F4777DRAFT_580664 [Nemania sp. FL0916]